MDEHLVFEAVEAGAELPGFSEMENVGFARGFAKNVFSAGFRSFFRFFCILTKFRWSRNHSFPTSTQLLEKQQSIESEVYYVTGRKMGR